MDRQNNYRYYCLLADLDPTRPLTTAERPVETWIQQWIKRIKMYFINLKNQLVNLNHLCSAISTASKAR